MTASPGRGWLPSPWGEREIAETCLGPGCGSRRPKAAAADKNEE